MAVPCPQQLFFLKKAAVKVMATMEPWQYPARNVFFFFLCCCDPVQEDGEYGTMAVPCPQKWFLLTKGENTSVTLHNWNWMANMEPWQYPARRGDYSQKNGRNHPCDPTQLELDGEYGTMAVPCPQR